MLAPKRRLPGLEREDRERCSPFLSARAENTFSRYRRLFGGRLRARGEMAQRNEALTAGNILNRMSELGMPRSERIATMYSLSLCCGTRRDELITRHPT